MDLRIFDNLRVGFRLIVAVTLAFILFLFLFVFFEFHARLGVWRWVSIVTVQGGRRQLQSVQLAGQKCPYGLA
jgi:hypothetical protein